MSYYVYVVSVDGIDRYVGKGNRYLHGLSGISSCKELNRDYFSGCTITVRFIFTGLSKLAALEREALTIRSYGDNQLYNKLRLSTRLRKNRGLKLNKITSYELKLVLDHWFKGGRGVIQKSFNHVFETTGKRNKEVDWCVTIPKAKHFGDELYNSLIRSEHPTAILIKGSKVFNKSDLTKRKPLTWRMREMDVIARFEEELEKQAKELEVALARIAELEGKRSWKDIALEALSSGKKQKEVAILVNKSLPTIKRLVSDSKLNKDKIHE